MTLDEDARSTLEVLEALDRLRTPRVLASRQGARTVVDGVEVLNFASNDYLGLAGDLRIASVAAEAIAEHGLGAGASRLIIGNHELHERLERDLADWLQCDATRLFNTGYAANVGVLTALLEPGDVVFSDELNHASIIDGCRLSRARTVVFPHRDVAALERLLPANPGRRRLIVSETLFSMDGDIADVEALSVLSRNHDTALLLDEAHAVGVYGPEGRGIAASRNVVPDLLVGTLGKALGTFGAFAASSRSVCDLLWNRARPFVFSTGLPPALPAATSRSLEIVRGREGEERRTHLHHLARAFREQVRAAGGAPDSPIAPIVIGDDRETVMRGRCLFESRLLVASVRPPTVPMNTARLRVSLAASHVSEDVKRLAAALGKSET